MFTNNKSTFLNVSLLALTLLIFLSGCMGPSPEENIYSTLEKVVTLEDAYKEQQQPLLELEKKESDLYNEIMNLGMKEFEKVVALSKEALTLINERESKIEAEYDSIISSKEEFAAVNEEIEKIDDEKLKEKAKDLKAKMEDRYTSYENLYNTYKTSISLDKELYIMLQKEDLTLESLEAQITKVNDSYKKVMEENGKFNKLTEEYNELKIDFYKNADLNVEEVNS